jgi:hypothetical protein
MGSFAWVGQDDGGRGDRFPGRRETILSVPMWRGRGIGIRLLAGCRSQECGLPEVKTLEIRA